MFGLALFDLAATLHKTLGELDSMTLAEFYGWQVWRRKRGASQG